MTIAITTLGAFCVTRRGVPIPASRWQSRKARDLVKILASRRGRPLAREQLADALWPDAPWERTANRLCVALSTVRAVLDPDRNGDRDTYVVTEHCAVRLNPATVAVDIDAFLAAYDAAMAARREGRPDAVTRLERALASYRGDFCEADPYEAWATGPREELRARHHDLVAALAESLADSPHPAAAVPHLTQLLVHDPYDEPAHRRLVNTLRRVGHHGAARDAYRRYAIRMAEIGVPPDRDLSPTTKPVLTT